MLKNAFLGNLIIITLKVLALNTVHKCNSSVLINSEKQSLIRKLHLSRQLNTLKKNNE